MRKEASYELTPWGGKNFVGPKLHVIFSHNSMSGEGEKTVMQERKGSVDESVVSSKVPEGAVESKTGVDGATVNPGGAVDVRVAVIGNVDSGKSTLVGCLTKVILCHDV